VASSSASRGLLSLFGVFVAAVLVCAGVSALLSGALVSLAPSIAAATGASGAGLVLQLADTLLTIALVALTVGACYLIVLRSHPELGNAIPRLIVASYVAFFFVTVPLAPRLAPAIGASYRSASYIVIAILLVVALGYVLLGRSRARSS
jgi:hypothetical protein